MPTVLRIRGDRFFFFSNEGDEPAHIHVETAEKYAKFWLDPVSLAQSVGYNAKQLTRLRGIVERRRDFFKEKWNEFFQG